MSAKDQPLQRASSPAKIESNTNKVTGISQYVLNDKAEPTMFGGRDSSGKM